MAPRSPKPAPVVVETRCSLCDLPWENHGDDPTTADCIRLLKAELATRPSPTIIYRDRPYWQNPWWYATSIGAASSATSGSFQIASDQTTTNNITYLTPRDEEPPDSISVGA